MMEVKPGKLNKRIKILEYQEIENEVAQKELKLKEILKRWASVKSTRGGDYYENLKVIPEITYILYCRYTKKIKPDMVIEYQGDLLDIKYVFDIEEKQKLLEIQCVEHKKRVKE